MGNISDVPDKNRKWEPELLKQAEQHLNSCGNPRCVPFANFKYPEEHEDPVAVKVRDVDDPSIEYSLKSYRYPPFYDEKDDQAYEEKLKNEFKGVLFYIHGFGEYVGRFAHVAQIYSQLGYDCFAMDQRGHGKSEGELVLIQSVDAIAND